MDNEDDKIYVVYRLHTPEYTTNKYEAAAIYGWSDDKGIVKAFLKQRDKKKYKVKKYTRGELAEEFSECVLDYVNQIDFIKLKSVTTGGYIYMLMTAQDAHEAELNIRKLFIDACSFSQFESNKYLEMAINLIEKYDDALYFIGYRPPELGSLYDSSDIRDGNDYPAVEDQINSAYDNLSPSEMPLRKYHSLPGALSTIDTFPKIINSLESFIKVLKNDM